MATINDAVRQMYLTQTGREADPGGLQYFADRFGSDIDPQELAIFRQMAADEVAGQEARQAAAAAQQKPAAEAAQQTAAAVPANVALNLMYRASTTGLPTATFDQYGGYAAVKAAAKAAGYTASDEFIQSYETANNLPSTIAAPVAAPVAAPTTTTTAPTESRPSPIGLAYPITAEQAARYAAEFDPNRTLAATTTTPTATGMSITQAYQQVLGRTPSASEIAYWTTQFGPDVDATELSNFSVAAQPERAATPTTNAAIQQMYQQVLGREPDAAGLKYFSDRFGADVDASELDIFKGMSTQEIAANAAKTAGTTTAAGTGATTAAGMSITQAYQQVLGRTPNASEIAYWTNQFGASVDPTELSTFSVAAQPERAAVPTTNDAVRQMYLSVLGREPDAAGLKYFSDRFGADVDASELGIFRGMSAQEIAANAARTAGTTTRTGTTTGTVQPITRPTSQTSVTGTQVNPAAVTNTAITGTPFTNVYRPATMRQDIPTVASIQAAAQSANPYASLMSLTPQRTLSPSYAAQAGQTAANTNLGGYDTSLYSKPLTGLLAPSTVAGGGGADGVNNSGDARGPGTNNTASNIDPLAVGMARVANIFSSPISLTTAPVTTGVFNPVGTSNAGGDYGGTGGVTGGSDTMGFGGEYAKGGKVNMAPQMNNPPGPDDGYAALDNGEYVIRKKAVQKYGANIFEQINAGKIPAKRLKSLLE